MVSVVSPNVSVISCENGLALMQYLQGLGGGDQLPCCIVLDVNMPIWDGLRTLEELKKHAQFRHVPVVMFTTSSSASDERRSRELGAEAFFTKPVSEAAVQELAEHFSRFFNNQSMVHGTT